MSNALILIVSVVVAFMSYLLFRRAAGTMALSRLNWISFSFYAGFLLHGLIGAVLIVMEYDGHPILDAMILPKHRFIGWAAILYAMIALPCGILIATRLLVRKPIGISAVSFGLRALQPVFSRKDIALRGVLHLLSAICVVSVLYSVWKSGGISVLVSASEGSVQAAELRGELGWEFSGIAWIRQIFGLILTPLLSYIAFAYWKMTSRRSCLIWFLIMATSSGILLTISLAKSALATYLLGYLFLLVLIRGRVPKIELLGFLIVGFGTAVVMYWLSYADQGMRQMVAFDNFNSSLATRTLFGQTIGLFVALDIFPDIHPHISVLRQMSGFVSFFGVEREMPYDLILAEIINPGGVSGYTTSLFPAEAWAVFGWPGLILGPWMVGLVIGVIWSLLFRLSKTPLLVGLYAFISYKLSITGGLILFFYNPNLIKAMAILFLAVWPVALMVRPRRSSPLGIQAQEISRPSYSTM
jgi:hypothetical protein